MPSHKAKAKKSKSRVPAKQEPATFEALIKKLKRSQRRPVMIESANAGDLKNPFHTESGKPWLAKAWVVFLDILGFNDLVRESSSNGTQAALLDKLMAALNEAKEILHSGNAMVSRFGGERASYGVKFFTDNIVLGFPVSDDGESEFGQLVFITGLYQYTLIKHGFFTRGGISFGELYMDGEVVFGNGILEAYEAESKLARDPRVVFAKSGADLMLSHLAYYAKVSETPHNRHILVDSDSQIFISYLAVPTDGLEELPQEFLDVLVVHRDLIADRLRTFAANPQIRPKYEWAAIYHNHIVRQFYHLPDDYSLPDDLILATPRPLSKVYRRKGAFIFKGDEKVAQFKSLFEYERQRRPK